jgi:hypothetical protein
MCTPLLCLNGLLLSTGPPFKYFSQQQGSSLWKLLFSGVARWHSRDVSLAACFMVVPCLGIPFDRGNWSVAYLGNVDWLSATIRRYIPQNKTVQIIVSFFFCLNLYGHAVA